MINKLLVFSCLILGLLCAPASDKMQKIPVVYTLFRATLIPSTLVFTLATLTLKLLSVELTMSSSNRLKAHLTTTQ